LLTERCFFLEIRKRISHKVLDFTFLCRQRSWRWWKEMVLLFWDRFWIFASNFLDCYFRELWPSV